MAIETITVEALSVAAFVSALDSMPHETRANVVALENGTPWAVVSLSPLTRTRRSVFPLYGNGVQGDTAKRGQSGVMILGTADPRNHDALTLVVNRAVRMHKL